MRIVAGRFRGRTLTAPEGRTTRPTADRTRQALFETLQSHPGDWSWAAIVSPEFMRN